MTARDPVSWDRLHADALTLAHRLAGLGPWRGIVAVSRGGLVPAALVARALGCRLVETVCIASYTGEAADTRQTPTLLKPPSAAGDGDGFVAVDDLVDTGETARLLRTILPRARLACLYAKPAGRAAADLFVREVPQDSWLVFPWDVPPPALPRA